MYRNIILLLLALAAPWVVVVRGQDAQSSDARRLHWLHDSLTGADRQFVCGALYRDPYGRTEGHPFLNDRGWQPATLVINGRMYRDIPLKYDICEDQLIYNHIHETGQYPVVLHRDRTGAFFIDGMHFVRFQSGHDGTRGAETGFYQEVVRGKASLYVRHTKRYEPPSSSSGGRFVPFRYSYVLTGESLHRIRSRRDLLRALPGREREVRNYMRRNHLVIRPEEGTGLVQAIRYFNSMEE